MTHPELAKVLLETGAEDELREQAELALLRSVAPSQGDADAATQLRLIRLGLMYETQALDAESEGHETNNAKELFATAFSSWASLASMGDRQHAVVMVERELADPHLSGEMLLALHLAVCGTLASRPSEVRLALKQFDLAEPNAPVSWERHVAAHIARSLVLLTRKANGWADVEWAISSVQKLRAMQQDFEAKWLDGQGESSGQQQAALRLVALYHLAQAVTFLAEYLTSGTGGSDLLESQLDRHCEHARKAATAAHSAQILHFVALVKVGSLALSTNSIWHHVAGIGKDAQEFAAHLMARGRERPLFELWPAQQQALGSHLLDPYPRAILVEMPTSAGKTLLAKFSIIQTHALATGTIVYVVPTRALVNQITMDLRTDLGPLGFAVEQAVPVFELDPTEERLLSVVPDVLVTTPEKLDLLIRKDHPVTKEIAMVVADEAHCIGDGTRGARLELLLGMVKRERPQARFLLLSPFVPGSNELLTWLGGNRTVPPIRVDWRPSRRIVGALYASGRKPSRHLTFETLGAADNVDVGSGHVVKLGSLAPDDSGRTLKGLVREAVNAFRSRGGILILCKGPGSTVTRAKELAEHPPTAELTPELTAVMHYVTTELGDESSLARCLAHGVAYHHSGLSHEARALIEGLIRRGQVSVICGTTTLAQGVNFPISTVLVETLKKGEVKLSYADFWNIAGRAGRALMDSTGLVAFPTPSPEQRAAIEEFLQGEAREVASQLANIVDKLDSIGEEFSLRTVANVPELSGFLQFLAHAMRIAGSDGQAASIDDVEELLRASLLYHQAKKHHGEAALQRLVQLCRSYLAQVGRLPSGTLSLADTTGFATPSVLALLARTRETPGLRSAAEWSPSSLFGSDIGPLTRRIGAIADLPEIRLGNEEIGPFNAKRVAAILRDWVSGASLSAMAETYRLPEDKSTPETRVTEFSTYLFSRLTGRASWGLGALESVCLAGQKDTEKITDAKHVPSMVFFGVRERESIWMRMVGVPRPMAPALGRVWKTQGRSEPASFDELRGWIAGLKDADWQHAVPRQSRLQVADLRVIWREIGGGSGDQVHRPRT